MQTQFKSTIKALQCDNGGEYDNKAFKDFLATQGTTFRFSCPYTSQQNGRAERMLCTEIPITRLFKTPARYTHLRTFGCLCYPNLLRTAVHKLAPRSTPCVFLGYPTDHRGFRCLDLQSRKIILSRHVTFDENIFPFSTSSQTPVSPSLEYLPPPPIIRRPSPSPTTPAVSLPSQSNHPMTTRSKSGIYKPRAPLCLHTDTTISP